MLILMTGMLLLPAERVNAGPVSEPAEAGSSNASLAGHLNPDGTLHLDGSYSGSLDLGGWNVEIDPERGPVFSPSGSREPAPAASISLGEWSDLGDGGGALYVIVNAIAVMGSDVYLGGTFTNANNIPEADCLAR